MPDYGLTKTTTPEEQEAQRQQINSMYRRGVEEHYSHQAFVRDTAKKYGFGGGASAEGGGSNGSNSSSDSSGGITGASNNFFQSAKDLAQMQMSNSEKMMGLSYGFRDREANRDQGFRQSNANQDSSLRMRESEQQFGFQRDLSSFKNQHELTMQSNQFGQERDMFRRQDEAGSRRTASNRAAASNLFASRRR